MFSSAYKIASEYTHPVLVSYRFINGEVESGLGSFVIINKEGWIITAAHILDTAIAQQQQAPMIQQYKSQVATIENNQSLSVETKEVEKAKLVYDPKWITNTSLWWGADHHIINHFEILRENDIAIGRIENYNPGFSKTYPVFKDPSVLEIGTSLCKLGHPFYDVKAKFDEANNRFMFDPAIFPIPRFPIDGMFTRNVMAGRSADQQFEIKFIETSTPGLRGQSGGPTFDIIGRIWAIQSQTRHLPLGFSPKINTGEKEVEENQFLNVGWGAHVETILQFLDKHKVRYQKG